MPMQKFSCLKQICHDFIYVQCIDLRMHYKVHIYEKVLSISGNNLKMSLEYDYALKLTIWDIIIMLIRPKYINLQMSNGYLSSCVCKNNAQVDFLIAPLKQTLTSFIFV